MKNFELLAIADSHFDSFLVAEKATLSREFTADMMASDEEDNCPILEMSDNIGVITIKGYLTNVSRPWNSWCGMVSYDEIRRAAILAQEKGAEAILFHHASSGGRVAGMSDLANFISDMMIPTVTFTDEVMASADLFLGIQSDHVYADKFSEVGSVGVIMQWLDYSGALKDAKITPRRYRTGDLKQAGSSYFKPSSKEDLYLQDQINTYGELFFQVVSDATGLTREMMDSSGITSGRTFIGQQAMDAGLVEGIITFDQAVMKTMQLAQKSLDRRAGNTVTFP